MSRAQREGFEPKAWLVILFDVAEVDDWVFIKEFDDEQAAEACAVEVRKVPEAENWVQVMEEREEGEIERYNPHVTFWPAERWRRN